KRGVFPLAWTLDHVGVLTRSVEDCALFLSAVAGHDPADPASSQRPVPDFDVPVEPAAPHLGLLDDALAWAVPRVRDHVTAIAPPWHARSAQWTHCSCRPPSTWRLVAKRRATRRSRRRSA